MNGPSQRVVIVEGFLDRTFVAGLFESRRHCVPLGASGKPPPKDPWGIDVKGGQFALKTKSEAFVRIVPCENGQLDAKVKLFARGANTKPIDQLLVIPDSDLAPGEEIEGRLTSKRANLCGWCSGTPDPSDPRRFSAPGIATAAVGVWAAPDPVAPHLPTKQTLERLVVAAFAEARPDWMKHAQQFLVDRPAPPPVTGREHAMTIMAGWFSHRFSEGFFRAVWEIDDIARALEARLQAVGTLDALNQLAV